MKCPITIMVKESVRFSVYNFQQLWVLFAIILCVIVYFTGNEENDLPIFNAILASIIPLLGLVFCLFYKTEFSRIDSSDVIEIRRQLTPMIKFSKRSVSTKDISIKNRTEIRWESQEAGPDKKITISFKQIMLGEEIILEYEIKGLNMLLGIDPIKKLEKMISDTERN
tara:strand:+ start:94 stop:597 length:504 start_codon:yes stop_codon:yes gene_type:complete